MNALWLMTAGIFAVVVFGCVRAEEKKADNAKLIDGVWEVVKSDEGKPPNGTVFEFTKDGKTKMSSKPDGKAVNFQGTYSVVSDKLTLVYDDGSGNEKKQTVKIKRLTATELVLEDKNSKSVDLKRQK